jgi:hypothetical protein
MQIRITFVADPNPAFHFNADPDTALQLNEDPDPDLHLNKDPDLAPHQGDANLRRLAYRPSRAPF